MTRSPSVQSSVVAAATAAEQRLPQPLMRREEGRVAWRPGLQRERRCVLEDLRGEPADVLEREAVEIDVGFVLESRHHRVA